MESFQTIGSVCIALHLRRAARRIGRMYDEALRPAGLNNGQFSLMTMVGAKEGWTMQTLADALGMDQSSLSAAIKPLTRRKLVEAAPSPDDRRVRTLVLTQEGRALLDEASPLWRKAQDRAEQLIAGFQPEEIRAALRRLA